MNAPETLNSVYQKYRKEIFLNEARLEVFRKMMVANGTLACIKHPNKLIQTSLV
jgi:hypothetical protein